MILSAIHKNRARSSSHGGYVLTLMATIVWMLVCATGQFALSFCGLNMELADCMFTANKDWDPMYLRYIFSQDFYEFHELWKSNICDKELVNIAEKSENERYTPIVEDILLDDKTLCAAVDQIEKEYVCISIHIVRLLCEVTLCQFNKFYQCWFQNGMS